MKLALYFARAYLAVLVLVQLGLIVIVVATTLVENAGYLGRSDESAATALGLSAYSAIVFAYQVFPIASFLAALVAGTQLARSGELLAVQAAGVAPRRIAVGFLAVVFLALVAVGIAGEVVVPRASARIEQLQRDELKRGDPLSRFYNRRSHWFRERDLLLYLPVVDSDDGVFEQVVVYQLDHGLISKVIEAARLEHDGAHWLLWDARTYDVASGELQKEPRLALPLSVSPAGLADVTGDPRLLRSAAIGELVARRSQAGFDVSGYRIEQHNRWAYPISAMTMFLLALPWVLDPNRRRSLAVSLGMGVAAVAVLLSTTQIFRLLALARRIPPPLGAWGLDMVCVVLLPASLYLARRVRTRGSLW